MSPSKILGSVKRGISTVGDAQGLRRVVHKA